jgi:hypothetical protein
MTETAMCWGFDWGDGWFNIIDKLCSQIQWHLDHNAEKETPQVVAVQVKEKYGTLRFYYDGGDRFIDGLESMATAMSAVTCELCGSPGKLVGNGWVRTLCKIHAEKQNYEWVGDKLEGENDE